MKGISVTIQFPLTELEWESLERHLHKRESPKMKTDNRHPVVIWEGDSQHNMCSTGEPERIKRSPVARGEDLQ